MDVQIRDVISRRKVEAHLRETTRLLEHGLVHWLVPRFLAASILGTAAALVGPALVGGDLGRILDPSARGYWWSVLSPVALAVPFTWWQYRRVRREQRRRAVELTCQLEDRWREVTGAGWVRRTLLTGGWLALGVGIPVGLLMALGFPASELPGGSRLLALVGFVTMTAMWTFPAAFAIRWASVRHIRRFLAAPDRVSVTERGVRP